MGNWQGKGKKGKAKVGEAELRQHVDNMKIEPRLTSVAATRDKGPKGRKPPTKMQKVMNLMRATRDVKKEKQKPKATEVVTRVVKADFLKAVKRLLRKAVKRLLKGCYT